MKILYISSMEGIPPLNYFQKFIHQKEGVDLDIMILPTYRSNFDGVEVEVHAGGQPLYPYLFGVE